jgi:maleylacetate reductase
MTGIGPFVFPGLRSRVIFGHGTIVETAAEIARLGRTRPMVLSTPSQKAEAEALVQRLGNRCVGAFAGAAMHTPVEVTETALTTFRARGADCVVALGGGSATRLDIAAKNSYWNPRPFDRAALWTLLQEAWEGKRPNQ